MISNCNYLNLDLKKFFNADAISTDSNRSDGALGGLSCFPAEDLPNSGTIATMNNIPFIIPPKEDGEFNNIECYKEEIDVPLGKYTKLHILGCSDNGSFIEKINFIYEEGESLERVGLTSSNHKAPIYNEELAFISTHYHSLGSDIQGNFRLWHQIVLLNENQTLKRILLPDNPCYHIFGFTLEKVVSNDECTADLN